MSARSRTESNTPIRITHAAKKPSAAVPSDHGHTDAAFDLAGTAYRVVLGRCAQEETMTNTDHSRHLPAKAETPVRKKEVIS